MRRAVRHPGTAGRVLTEQERPADVDGARAYKLGAEKPASRTLARWGEQYRDPGCLNPRPEPEVG